MEESGAFYENNRPVAHPEKSREEKEEGARRSFLKHTSNNNKTKTSSSSCDMFQTCIKLIRAAGEAYKMKKKEKKGVSLLYSDLQEPEPDELCQNRIQGSLLADGIYSKSCCGYAVGGNNNDSYNNDHSSSDEESSKFVKARKGRLASEVNDYELLDKEPAHSSKIEVTVPPQKIARLCQSMLSDLQAFVNGLILTQQCVDLSALRDPIIAMVECAIATNIPRLISPEGFLHLESLVIALSYSQGQLHSDRGSLQALQTFMYHLESVYSKAHVIHATPDYLCEKLGENAEAILTSLAKERADFAFLSMPNGVEKELKFFTKSAKLFLAYYRTIHMLVSSAMLHEARMCLDKLYAEVGSILFMRRTYQMLGLSLGEEQQTQESAIKLIKIQKSYKKDLAFKDLQRLSRMISLRRQAKNEQKTCKARIYEQECLHETTVNDNISDKREQEEEEEAKLGDLSMIKDSIEEITSTKKDELSMGCEINVGKLEEDEDVFAQFRDYNSDRMSDADSCLSDAHEAELEENNIFDYLEIGREHWEMLSSRLTYDERDALFLYYLSLLLFRSDVDCTDNSERRLSVIAKLQLIKTRNQQLVILFRLAKVSCYRTLGMLTAMQAEIPEIFEHFEYVMEHWPVHFAQLLFDYISTLYSMYELAILQGASSGLISTSEQVTKFISQRTGSDLDDLLSPAVYIIKFCHAAEKAFDPSCNLQNKRCYLKVAHGILTAFGQLGYTVHMADMVAGMVDSVLRNIDPANDLDIVYSVFDYLYILTRYASIHLSHCEHSKASKDTTTSPVTEEEQTAELGPVLLCINQMWATICHYRELLEPSSYFNTYMQQETRYLKLVSGSKLPGSKEHFGLLRYTEHNEEGPNDLPIRSEVTLIEPESSLGKDAHQQNYHVLSSTTDSQESQIGNHEQDFNKEEDILEQEIMHLLSNIKL